MTIHLIDTTGPVHVGAMRNLDDVLETGDRCILMGREIREVRASDNGCLEMVWHGGTADFAAALAMAENGAGDEDIVCYTQGEGLLDEALLNSKALWDRRLRIVDLAEGQEQGLNFNPEWPVKVEVGNGVTSIRQDNPSRLCPLSAPDIYDIITGNLFEVNIGDPEERMQAARIIFDLIEEGLRKRQQADETNPPA